jgi:hypothetical protein
MPLARTNSLTHGLKLYLPIQESTDTMISKVLDSLYQNNEYQKIMTDLENGQEKEMKKATDIKKILGKLRAYGSKENPLLLARDVGVLIDISESKLRLMLKDFDSSEKVPGLYQIDSGKTRKVEYLTENGFIKLAYGANRSAICCVFRKLFSSMIALVTNDPSKLDEVSKLVIKKNPELVNQAINDLKHNLKHYILLYEHETQLRLTAEKKQADAELDAILYTQKTQQMQKYINRYENTLLDAYEWPTTNEIELNILRHKYLKPLFIYAPSSKMYNEWSLKTDEELTDFLQYMPEYPDRIDYIATRINELINRGVNREIQNGRSNNKEIQNGRSNNKEIQNGRSNNKELTKNDEEKILKCLVQEADNLYFYMHMGPMPQLNKQSGDYVHVATEWIVDKKHYEAVIEEMNKECIKVMIKKKMIYYSSVEEIHCIVSQKMIDLNKMS